MMILVLISLLLFFFFFSLYVLSIVKCCKGKCITCTSTNAFIMYLVNNVDLE